jgi:drug/metabolite transporter (DMT)-like permease
MILFASIAAIGNALFALGLRHASGFRNGLLFVAASALLAAVLALAVAPFVGALEVGVLVREHGRALLFSGTGLFLTYVGLNLLYGRFGTSPYVLYSALAIISTTVGVGFLYLKEPVNAYHVAAVLLALSAVALFSFGQSRL